MCPMAGFKLDSQSHQLKSRNQYECDLEIGDFAHHIDLLLRNSISSGYVNFSLC